MLSTCPDCQHEVDVRPSARLSEIVDCPHCSLELELVTTDPPMLAIAPEPEEDWGE